jgi:hypothetical protein
MLSVFIEDDALNNLHDTREARLSYPEEYAKVLGSFHNSETGHFGVEKTINLLISKGHRWEHMRNHVRAFIKKCPCCQLMSQIKPAIHTLPFTTATYNPMESLNVDTIGPLPADEDGNTYLQLENTPGSFYTSIQLEEAELFDPAVDGALAVYGSVDPGINSSPSYGLVGLEKEVFFSGFEVGFTPTFSFPWKTGGSKNSSKKTPFGNVPKEGNWAIEVGGGLKGLTYDRTKDPDPNSPKRLSSTWTAQGKAGVKLKVGKNKIDSPYQEAGGNEIENTAAEKNQQIAAAKRAQEEAVKNAEEAKNALREYTLKIDQFLKQVKAKTKTLKQNGKRIIN